MSHLGVRNVLLERGDKPENEGGGVDVEMEGVATFLLLYSSVGQGGGGVRFPLLIFGFSVFLVMQDSHLSLYCTKTWYHLYISDLFW